MYSVGELVIYNSTGVCRVNDITEREGRKFYVLKPLYQSCIISAPVDSTKVFMRPVISREEAEHLISVIPTINAKAYYSKALSQLAEHYETAIKSHNCYDLIELIMSIYEKKKNCERMKKKFGAVDERFMKRAEDLLYGELGAALDIPRDQVHDYIAASLNDLKIAASE